MSEIDHSLETVNLTKNFGGKMVANHVNVKFKQGFVSGLIGPNGAGKTTLFNLISGNIKSDYGDVYLGGKKINKMSDYQRARLGIARTWQMNRLFNSLSLIDNLIISQRSDYSDESLSLGLFDFNRAKKDALYEDIAANLLKRVGLLDYRNSVPAELSYGQQKLVAIARALMNDGNIIMLDEPMAGVEGRTHNKIKEIILEEKTRKKTIIVIEHNMRFIREICDEGIFLVNGQIKAVDSVASLMNDVELTRIYFGG